MKRFKDSLVYCDQCLFASVCQFEYADCESHFMDDDLVLKESVNYFQQESFFH